MSNILVTGSEGQLGSELCHLAQKYPEDTSQITFFYIDRSSLDLTDHQAVEDFLVTNSIDTIINCAAYTAVDKAETDEAAADAINHLAVKNLAQMAKERSILLVHISTDYVFDGTGYRPYAEEDSCSPQSIYGKTKLDGERAIQEISPKGAVIIRTSWVYSSFGNNFVKTMLRLGSEREQLSIIYDQIGTPTYARDLAKAILHIVNHPNISQNSVEIYHYSNEGVCSWYDFAKAIFELTDTNCTVKPIRTEEYPTPAKRPNYSLLDKSKIKNEYQISIPYWRDSLKECLALITKNGVGTAH